MSSPPLAQLQWRCRRGTRELDLLLQHYLHVEYPLACTTEQQAFLALLDLSDPLLQAYLTGALTPDSASLHELVRKIRHRSEA